MARRTVKIRTATTLLIVSVCLLLCVGIVMLASTSSVRATDVLHDPSFYLRRQLVWLALALVAAYAAARVDYRVWKRYAPALGVVALVLLALVFVPGIGMKIGGSHRWLNLRVASLQPSEVAKLAMIVCLAAWMARIERRAATLKLGLIYPMAGIGLTLALLIAEPDYGTTLLCGAVGMLILFAGGSRPNHLLVTGVAGGCLFTLAILQDRVRLGRMVAFLFPEQNPAVAYQLAQSKVAFVKGGMFGVGLGNSIQKQFYLPEAHTDFILAIIGEELGLIATTLVLLMFVMILISGLMISFRAPDTFGRLMGFGITVMLVTQAGLNMGVVTGCLPTKGLPLPFISYGGSSMVAALTCVGILLSIAQAASEEPDDVSRSVKDRARRL